MAVKASVIVVNWNGKQYLRECLGSLLEQTYSDMEVLLVDNASTDGSLELVRSEFPSVRVLQNDHNAGFAAASNRGIRASNSEFVATLNNDARAEPCWLARLVEALDEDGRIGACSSKMVFEQAPRVINSTGISIDRVGIAWDRYGGRSDDGESNRACEVFGACAGAALYRREMLDQIGLFDEDFFAYMEDVDLAWRARLAGWVSVFVPDAKVYHAHSGTAIEGSPFKNFLLGRNKIWTIIKNYPTPDLYWRLPLIIFYDLASVQYSILLRGDLSALKGRLSALRSSRKMLAKRRAVQGGRVLGLRDLGHVIEPAARPDKLLRRYQHIKAIQQAKSTLR